MTRRSPVARARRHRAASPPRHRTPEAGDAARNVPGRPCPGRPPPTDRPPPRRRRRCVTLELNPRHCERIANSRVMDSWYRRRRGTERRRHTELVPNGGVNCIPGQMPRRQSGQSGQIRSEAGQSSAPSSAEGEQRRWSPARRHRLVTRAQHCWTLTAWHCLPVLGTARRCGWALDRLMWTASGAGGQRLHMTNAGVALYSSAARRKHLSLADCTSVGDTCRADSRVGTCRARHGPARGHHVTPARDT